MATLGTQALTMSDYKKRLAPDGSTAFIIEALEKSNPILQDARWKEGNLPTGNVTTIRTSLPTPSIRKINRGVKRSKSTTKQVQDTCIILEDRSNVDIELLALQKDKEGFRRSEDAAFVQGFSEVAAKNPFYGDTEAGADTFNGLSIRYNTLQYKEDSEPGHQVISAGTAGTNNTSIYIVGWGTQCTCGIYPKNTQMGLKHRDLGEMTVQDSEGREYQALQSLFTWKLGLSVQNIRANALVRNIDVSKLTTAAYQKSVIEAIIKAKNRIQGLDRGDKQMAMYVSEGIYNMLEIWLSDKNNVHVTRQELMGQMPQLYFAGLPVKKCDAISEAEPAVE